MGALGQFGPISILPYKEVMGTFTVSQKKSLAAASQPCEADDQYSFTDCLSSYVTRIANCSVDIIRKRFNCTSEGLVKLFDTLNRIKLSTKRNVTNISGCLPKCTTLNYNFQLKEEEDVTWRKDWISAFYLSSETTSFTKSEENYTYDEQVAFLRRFSKMLKRYYSFIECVHNK